MRGRTFSIVVAVSVAVSACAATVDVKPEGHAFSPNVTMVVGLPSRLEFGRQFEGRANRHFGDALIAATGGRTILPEELAGLTGPRVLSVARVLGADIDHTISFKVIATRAMRAENSMSQLRGTRGAVFLMVDYHVKLEVRRLNNDELLGTVQTFASAQAEADDIGIGTQTSGLPAAMNDAIKQAVQKFASALASARPPLRLVEVPAGPEAGLSVDDRLSWLTVLYPELPADRLRPLATSTAARFLVVEPGPLMKVGVVAGDLLGGARGRALGTRAALARDIATGKLPPLFVERAGERFLIAETRLAQP